jgi:hypothetical protein
MAAPCRTLHTFPNKCVAAAAAAALQQLDQDPFQLVFPFPNSIIIEKR